MSSGRVLQLTALYSTPANSDQPVRLNRSLFLFRPHAVKPLSTADKQPDLRETQDASRSAKITDDMQVEMKVA